MDHRRLLLLLFLVVVFLASTTQAGGHGQQALQQQQGGTGGVGSVTRSMVGSRPPSCAGRCWWCSGRRRCEAVQVPATPQLQELNEKGSSIAAAAAAAAEGDEGRRRRRASHSLSSSYDDRSNYKPLSWRCMCGEVIVILDP